MHSDLKWQYRTEINGEIAIGLARTAVEDVSKDEHPEPPLGYEFLEERPVHETADFDSTGVCAATDSHQTLLLSDVPHLAWGERVSLWQRGTQWR